MTRYDVMRTNGREVEVVRRLTLAQARRLVERDRMTGTESYLTPAANPRPTYR